MRTLTFLAAVLAALPAAAETAADPKPTWAGEVAAVVHQRCASCHRPGEVAPMSLLTYAEARPWAKSIRKAVADRAMPPWHADSSKVAYLNDRSLSQEEIDTLVAWVDAGAPAGDLDTAPAPPAFEDGWRLGEPDLVFSVARPFTVPVTEDEIPYQSLVFDADLPEDLHVAAWELRSSAPGALHHANLVRQPVPFEGSVGIAGAVFRGGDYIGSYLPGHNWVRYPERTALRLPKGSHLGIQIHYVSVGEEVTDRLELGLHLADGRVDRLVRVIGTDYRDLEIPPGEERYAITDEITVLYDLLALSSGIHMHLRGAAYTMEAVRPDGTVELITEVPDYDFDWQSNYVLAEPVAMPKGSKLRVTSVWDNSANNPDNPDPTATVRYGPWTDDEMVNSWAHVVLEGEKLGLLVEDGRVVGRAPDAQESDHPFLIQTLPQAPSFSRVEGGQRSRD